MRPVGTGRSLSAQATELIAELEQTLPPDE